MQIIKSILISFLIIFLLFPVLRFMLVRIIPIQRRRFHLTTDEMEEFRKLEWILILLHAVFATILAVVITSILTVSTSMKYYAPEKYLYILTPSFLVFLIPGIMLGLSLGVVPLLLLQRTVLQERYLLFNEYIDQAYGFDIRKFYYTVLTVTVFISSFLIYTNMRRYVLFGDTKIVVKEYLQKEKEYTYADVRELRQKSDDYYIELNDGNTISTKYLQPQSFEMIAYLAQKTGLHLKK
ncbi:MAG: hypothetical protein LPK19_09085 [Hymenobacteraceae bacterium]|nr:hypothetical protein [Hymenobacteraceae bacterium]MDX5396375.1 hypothetical protein [Hymenobacteraceae bacterium]MDX5512437.1 hypothetical protein [Hymenobacteraceae bacterium]